jgi:CHAT domain-containing protein/tetratricopeptide (TPR) repeat protein
MLRRKLAEKLISAENEPERKHLLDENKNQADTALALALKEICYESWTTEPTKAQNAAKALKSLLKINPNEETEALCFWVTGISELTRGRLESAVENLDKSAAAFTKIKQEHTSAQTQVAKLIALALLGRYEEAVKSGEKALKIFKSYKDELAAGKIEKNLGNIVSRRELHKEAEKYYLSARKRFLKLGDTSELIMCENGLAITYSALNDFRRAEKFYAQALEKARRAKMFVTEAEIEASMGNLAIFRGKYAEALKFLELSRRKYENLQMPYQTAVAELEIADIYAELNLAQEAFEIYEKVAGELKELKLQAEEARARANFGRVAAVLQETGAARRELKKSARLYELEGNPVGGAVVKLSQANLELSQGKYENALKILREAEKVLQKTENLRHKLSVKWLHGEVLCNLKKYKPAERFLTETYAEAARNEQLAIAENALNSLGNLSMLTKNPRKAKSYFKKAVKMIETLRAPLPAEEFRMAFLADKLAPYENLAQIYLSEGKLKDAFSMVEKARSRSLAETLGGGLKDFEMTKAPLRLAKKLEILREELNWFYSRLNRAEEAEIECLQGEVKQREKQITDVMRQIESTRTSGEKSAKRDAAQNGFSLKHLQNLLGGEKAFIEFLNFDEKLSAFVVTDKKIHFVADLAKESEVVSMLEDLQFQFGALRYGAKNLGNFMNELKKRADFRLEKLYEKLLKPLEAFIEKRNLVIAPAGATHYVPFHALRAGANYVIETREVVYAPSATVWQALSEKPERKLENALLIGFADEKIPLVNEEIKALRKIFPATKSFTGKAATFAAYTLDAPKFDVLHFACHGQFRAENPLFSSLHLADGSVTVRDICAQNLQADLVTLSACETGLNKIYAGDEILGLARGFLSAGVSSLILSLWTVNDAAAAELMKDFYKNLQRGANVSASLRLAQNNFIKRGAHPYFWSPFALIGR